MNPGTNPPPGAGVTAATPAPRRSRLGLWLLFGAAALLALPLVLIAGCFRVGSATRDLRDAALHAVPGEAGWNHTVELRFGPVALGLVRAAAAWVDDIPPEGRAALRAVRRFQVGIYQFGGAGEPLDRGALLAAATRGMDARAWAKLVAVIDGETAVAVFVPRASDPGGPVEASVLVFDGSTLVVGAAQLDLDEVVALALERSRFDL